MSETLSADGRPSRFLLLYGSARPGSLSGMLAEEAAALLREAGGEARVFDPAELPLPQTAPPTHPRIAALHEALLWSDAQFWCTPENYGSMSAVIKAQIDSAPPVLNGVPVFRNKPLAIAQVNGADPSLSASVALATVGRWLGMILVPAQLCVAKAPEQFENNRLKPGTQRDQLATLVADLARLTAALRR